MKLKVIVTLQLEPLSPDPLYSFKQLCTKTYACHKKELRPVCDGCSCMKKGFDLLTYIANLCRTRDQFGHWEVDKKVGKGDHMARVAIGASYWL